MVDTNVQRAVFDPVERAILSDYFGVERAEDLRAIDIHAATDEIDPASGERRVRLRPNDSGKTCELTVPNAVARIALNPIRRKLPPWYLGNEDGTIILGRDDEPALRRDVRLKAVFIFSINGACSGPGYDWPVDYYVTWIPGFDRFVVTSSADCPDALGYADVALGHFAGSTDMTEGCCQVLVENWRSERECQPKWEEFTESGLVDNVEADEWVDGVLLTADEF